eukprot:TRINITY_DN1269_c1_g1_i1.p1 TRINITY_DN1269_c1_g1~~TRINITY_DN1269_c1_g1_i1.p1  ORF type:complete len:181 (-),score=70.90 TRINITY_DN1269_c1_g1_i1:353-895(-)
MRAYRQLSRKNFKTEVDLFKAIQKRIGTKRTPESLKQKVKKMIKNKGDDTNYRKKKRGNVDYNEDEDDEDEDEKEREEIQEYEEEEEEEEYDEYDEYNNIFVEDGEPLLFYFLSKKRNIVEEYKKKIEKGGGIILKEPNRNCIILSYDHLKKENNLWKTSHNIYSFDMIDNSIDQKKIYN